MRDKNEDYRPLGRCRFCNEEVFGTHHNKLIAHQRFCLCNPNRDKEMESRTRGSITMNRKVCERMHQRRIEDQKTRKPRLFKCVKCGSDYYLDLTDIEYNRYLRNPKDKSFRKHCTQKCANSRSKKEIEKQVKSFKRNRKKYIKEHKNDVGGLKRYRRQPKPKVCKTCGKEYFHIRGNGSSETFCSEKCRNERPISEETRKKLSAAGKKSSSTMKVIRRSKNEMLFCKLCEENFSHVENNKPIFNGWDADVLIYDFKIAVLWNGKWHYVQVMKNQNTSLKCIQNRDSIKMSEITKHGWIPYVIKDMGKYKVSFVEDKFKEFMTFINDLKIAE